MKTFPPEEGPLEEQLNEKKSASNQNQETVNNKYHTLYFFSSYKLDAKRLKSMLEKKVFS